MKEFTKQLNDLLTAMNNIIVQMPNGYEGAPPTLTFKNGSLVFDFGSALVFSERTVDWTITGDATINSFSAVPNNGRLAISVDASAYDSVQWFLEGTATYNSYSVEVLAGGILKIVVDAD